MRHGHDFEPIVAHGFERRNALAHAVHQDFPAAARDGTEPGFFEVTDDLLQRLVEHFAEMYELARAETMNVDMRKFAFDVMQQVEIPLLAELRMMSALHQDLRPAERNGLLDFPVQR